MRFDDARVDLVQPSDVITKDAYVLFFRRVFDAPSSLENLRAHDARCQEGSEWLKELAKEAAGSEMRSTPSARARTHVGTYKEESDEDAFEVPTSRPGKAERRGNRQMGTSRGGRKNEQETMHWL